MNYGKLSEDVYERSVVKVIKTNSKENRKFYDGAGIGDFCAVVPYADTACNAADGTNASAFVKAQAFVQASAGGKNAVARAYEAALNRASAKGVFGDTKGGAYAGVTLFIPERLREIKVRGMLAETAQRADELQIPVRNVTVQVLPWISVETANCVIHMTFSDKAGMKGAAAGDDIVMTKWLGLEGTAVLARSSPDMLKARYPADIVEEAADFLKYISVIPEAACAVKSGASYMQAAGEGGIFGGLWELAANNSVGLVADLRSIPVRQETIEVCEYFDLNPYTLMAGGSLLITCKNGGALVQELAQRGIFAAVIGKITEGKDRIIRHADENRFLEPVRGDELYQYYAKKS